MTSIDLVPALEFPAKPRRHSWNLDTVKHLAAVACKDGNGRTERTCEHCGMVKITVHYQRGLPGREWRTRKGDLWQGQMTPPCLEVVT
mgnify:FL=1